MRRRCTARPSRTGPKWQRCRSRQARGSRPLAHRCGALRRLPGLPARTFQSGSSARRGCSLRPGTCPRCSKRRSRHTRCRSGTSARSRRRMAPQHRRPLHLRPPSPLRLSPRPSHSHTFRSCTRVSRRSRARRGRLPGRRGWRSGPTSPLVCTSRSRRCSRPGTQPRRPQRRLTSSHPRQPRLTSSHPRLRLQRSRRPRHLQRSRRQSPSCRPRFRSSPPPSRTRMSRSCRSRRGNRCCTPPRSGRTRPRTRRSGTAPTDHSSPSRRWSGCTARVFRRQRADRPRQAPGGWFS